MSFLRQSTASQVRSIGPFVDDTDFKTVKNALTISNTDIKIKKNGATAVNKNSGGATADVNGEYGLTFDATDTNTLGELEASVLVAGALVVKKTWMVIAPSAYDAMLAANPNTSGILWYGTLSAIAAGSITLPGGNGLDHQGNYMITLLSGTNAAGKSRYLTYSGTGEVWNVDPAWNSDAETTPSGTITAIVTPVPKVPTAVLPNVNASKLGGQTVNDPGGAVTVPTTIASPTNITTVGAVAGSVASVTGNVGGSVASVTGNVGGNVVGSVASVTGNVGGNVVGSVGSVSGDTKQTGDVFALLNSATAEQTSVPAANASLAVKINYIFSKVTNKITQTATQLIMRNRADSANVATASVSDDGTTYTKGTDA